MMKLEDQLAVVYVILILIVSTSSGHLHSQNPRTVNANFPTDHCHLNLSKSHLICSGGFHGEWNNGSDNIRFLTLSRWPKESLDPAEVLNKFPALEELAIISSNLTNLATSFPNTAKYLRKLRINGTKLDALPEDAFSTLPALSILDLRHNALSFINDSALAGPSLEDLFLFGNPWKCELEISWILNLTNDSVASRVVDRDKLVCSGLHYDRPLVPVVEAVVELDKECPKKICSCELSYVGRSRGGPTSERKLMVFASVNCSSRGLKAMPETLPRNTSTLYLTKNQIHDLSPLKTNPTYHGVQDVYLDDNEVESIAILEGSDWLDQFRALSLRGNRLTYVPPYALENALQQNHRAASVFLGRNPWRCDCHFTPGFQDLLSKRPGLFKDVRDIKCAKVEYDENSDKPVMDLTRTAICTSPDDEYWIQPLDVLNVVLASLIFFVFGKLLYDYWTFKRTGKLPWIVARIP